MTERKLSVVRISHSGNILGETFIAETDDLEETFRIWTAEGDLLAQIPDRKQDLDQLWGEVREIVTKGAQDG